MMKHRKAIALFSGGLDSLLAVKWMQAKGYEVIPVFFAAPYLNAERAQHTASENGLELLVQDFFEAHFALVKNPSWGLGKHLNPCVDCHALMFALSSQLLDDLGASFIISGEVLGQRPMSQKRNAMAKVSAMSKVRDLIVRPLSQKLLPDTKPITEGWVNKEELLDLSGRSRKPQLALAEELGIVSFPTPAGGCLLTDRNYCLRLQDLIDHGMDNRQQMEILRWGRHFRLGPSCKLIVGRNEAENDHLELNAQGIMLLARDNLGPLGVIVGSEPSPQELELALSIFLQYNSKAQDRDWVQLEGLPVSQQSPTVQEQEVTKLSRESCNKYLLSYDR